MLHDLKILHITQIIAASHQFSQSYYFQRIMTFAKSLQTSTVHVDSVGYQGKPVIREEVWYEILQDWNGGVPIVQNLMNETSYFFSRDFSDWEGPFRFYAYAVNERGRSWFSNIEELYIDLSDLSITTIITDDCLEEIHDLQGRQQSELKPGLNIIRKEGTAIKIWK